MKSHITTEEINDDAIGRFLLHKCSLCNFTTNDETTIKQHECQQVRVIGCCFCNFECRHLNNLNLHLKMHSKLRMPKKYECLLCLFDCDSRCEYLNHLKTHSWHRPFKCSLCPFTSYYELRFKSHSIYHKEVPQGAKNETNRKIENKSGQNENDNSVCYNCHICGKYFGSRCNLDKHKSRHDFIGKFVCHFCGISFSKRSNLFKHLVIYTKNSSRICHKCKRLFNSRAALKQHLECCSFVD